MNTNFQINKAIAKLKNQCGVLYYSDNFNFNN